MTMQIFGLDGSFVPGQNANIHGSSFGSTQDPSAYVLLWPSDDETPKTVSVVSWSDSTITVTIPSNTLQNIPGAFFTVVRPAVTPLGARSPIFTTGEVVPLYSSHNWAGRAVESHSALVIAAPPPYAHVPVGQVGSDYGTTVDVSWLPTGYSAGLAKSQLQIYGTLSVNYLKQTLQANIP